LSVKKKRNINVARVIVTVSVPAAYMLAAVHFTAASFSGVSSRFSMCSVI
jgi:hypothetical protein